MKKNRYRKQFQQGMEEYRQYRSKQLGGDPGRIPFLFPELDVTVDMSVGNNQSYTELRQMHIDGIMSKKQFAEHIYRNRNLPMDQMELFDWPDRVPHELLGVKPKEGGAEPKKKKQRKE